MHRKKITKNIEHPVIIYAISSEGAKSDIELQKSGKDPLSELKTVQHNSSFPISGRRLYPGIAAVILFAVILLVGYFIYNKKTSILNSASSSGKSVIKEGEFIFPGHTMFWVQFMNYRTISTRQSKSIKRLKNFQISGLYCWQIWGMHTHGLEGRMMH